MCLEKNKRGLACSALILAYLFLAAITAAAQQTLETKDFAVEVAVLRSEDCAVELANGLITRGHDAYWLKHDQPEYGTYYRVRIGIFNSLDEARGYAEDLLDSGLLENCSVTVYEAPIMSLLGFKGGRKASGATAANLADSALANSCPIRLSDLEDGSPQDLISVIGKNRWALSASRSVIYSLPQKRSARPVNDVVLLMRAVDRNRWRLKNDIQLLLAPPVKKQPRVPTFAPPSGAVAAEVMRAATIARTSNPSVVTNAARVIDPVVPPRIPVAVDPRGFEKAAGLNPTLSGAGRNVSLSPARAVAPPPPKIQGAIEMVNGRMVMRLRNLDQQRGFTGVARITLTDDKQNNDVAPLQVALQPNEERTVAVADSTMEYGDWMLMVYDDRQAVRLIRSASFGQRPVEALPAGVTLVNAPEIEGSPWRLTESAENNTSANGLPNVTGTFDATGPVVSPQPAPQAPQPQSSNAAAPVAGNIRVLPRQLASTSDNVTMEFEIAAPQPLGYITLIVRAGNYQEERQALMSSPNSRIPFLIPASDAKGSFSYEIRDELGKSRSAGVGDFKQLGAGN